MWADVSVTEVIDAGHVWAHLGGEHVLMGIQQINKTLLNQVGYCFLADGNNPEPLSFSHETLSLN